MLLHDLEYHSFSESTSENRRAIKIAGWVENQSSIQVSTICAAAEIVKNGFCPTPPGGRRQLENRTFGIGATFDRCAVQIAGGVEDHAGSRGQPVILAAPEIAQLHFFPKPVCLR